MQTKYENNECVKVPHFIGDVIWQYRVMLETFENFTNTLMLIIIGSQFSYIRGRALRSATSRVQIDKF